MLNTPNEWHNEEYTEDEKAPENFANGNYDGEYSDDEYSDDEYGEDEYVDDDEDNGNDGRGGNSKNKIIIIAVIAAVALLVVIGGIIGFTSMKNKNSSEHEQQSQVESFDEQGMDVESEENGDEISIDVESEEEMGDENREENHDENPDEHQGEGEGNGPDFQENEQQGNNDNGNEGNEGGLDVPPEQRSPLADVVGQSGNNGDVSIAIGDTGRTNPFKPNIEQQQKLAAPAIAAANTVREKYSFDVIEPPELGIEDLDLARLMQTKVTGILYDNIKPSAIVNIDGSDQLVSIGDNVGGFEIASITKNKVVIRDGKNIFRASVGQPLNAEKVVNPVEISNLETKFAGSTKH